MSGEAVGIVALVLAGLYAIDRLMLALEARGHVYWRRRQASPGTTASAMLELHALLEPQKRHVQRVQTEGLAVVDEDQDDDAPPSELLARGDRTADEARR